MLLEPLQTLTRMTSSLRELAPELTPELAAIDARTSEVCAHITAILKVLEAKVDLL